MEWLAGGDVTGKSRRRPQRRDRRDGCCRWRLQGQHDRGGTSRRRKGRRERRQDAPRPGSRRTHRVFEAKVTELVGGLSSASSIMEDTHSDVVDRHPHQPSGGHRRRRFRTDFRNVQTVASATEELSSSISEIGRQVANRPKSPRARSTMRGVPATPPARSPMARRRSAMS